jgi:Protein of unknown function (DUF3054)
MQPLTDGSKLARASVIGDLVALLVFLVVGIEKHTGNLSGRFLALSAVFLGSWLVTAWFVGTYRPVSNGRLALTLVLAVPLAATIRAVTVGTFTTTEVLTFIGVALLFCALFVGAARVIILLAYRWRAST